MTDILHDEAPGIPLAPAGRMPGLSLSQGESPTGERESGDVQGLSTRLRPRTRGGVSPIDSHDSVMMTTGS